MNRVLHKWIQIATLTDMTLLPCFMYCQFAEARRNQQIEQLTKDRKQQHSYQMTEWKGRFIEKQKEATRRAHEDNVRHRQISFFLYYSVTHTSMRKSKCFVLARNLAKNILV